jgi:hypothetical protein
MTPYSSRSGKRSGVTAYEAGEDYLLVQFHAAVYKYSYASCGPTVVEKMKRLATASKGLSTFIARHQPAYEGKM